MVYCFTSPPLQTELSIVWASILTCLVWNGLIIPSMERGINFTRSAPYEQPPVLVSIQPPMVNCRSDLLSLKGGSPAFNRAVGQVTLRQDNGKNFPRRPKQIQP